MSQDHVSDLLPGYALGCLDDEELLHVTRHLSLCSACRVELAGYQQTAERLAMAGPAFNPAPELKQKVLARVRRASKQQAPVRNSSFLDFFRLIFSQRLGLALGGAVLLLLVLLLTSTLVLWKQNQDLQARAPVGSMRLVALKGTTEAPQTSGYLMVFKDETYGTLTVSEAPLLDPGQQYQLWLIKDGKRRSGGVFSVGQDGYGVMQVSADSPLDSYQSFGITIEPLGGSPAPTGKKILGSNT
jgi:anti-sigma-K factor RskA